MKPSEIVDNAIFPITILVTVAVSVLVTSHSDFLFYPAILGAVLELFIIVVAFKLFFRLNQGLASILILLGTTAFVMFMLIPYINATWFNWLMSGVFVVIIGNLFGMVKALKMIGK